MLLKIRLKMEVKMAKLLFQYLTDSYALLENPVDNYYIMGVVGVISFIIAYGVVGWFYDGNLISGRSAGSILHWTIRFIVFVVIYYAVATVIRIYKWIVELPIYVWWIIGLSLFVIGTVAILIKITSLRKTEVKK